MILSNLYAIKILLVSVYLFNLMNLILNHWVIWLFLQSYRVNVRIRTTSRELRSRSLHLVRIMAEWLTIIIKREISYLLRKLVYLNPKGLLGSKLMGTIGIVSFLSMCYWLGIGHIGWTILIHQIRVHSLIQIWLLELVLLPRFHLFTHHHIRFLNQFTSVF